MTTIHGADVEDMLLDDVHEVPTTWNFERQHELTRECWCGPSVKPRIGSPGCLVVHAKPTRTECTVPGCDRLGYISTGFCQFHHRRFVKNGDPLLRRLYKPGPRQQWLLDRAASGDRSHVLWPFPINATHGRPVVSWDHRHRLVSHVVLELDGRRRPNPSLIACHSCDTAECVGAECLRWDTHAGNIADAVERDRIAHGDSHHWAKLDEAKVRLIRRLIAEGASNPELGRLFGVSASCIADIRNGDTWRRVA